MKRYRISSETDFYYSTCTITAWLPVFQDERYFQVIIESLKYCQQFKGLYLLGYVIMPTHLHLITSNSEKTSLSDIMRDFRHYTSSHIRKLLESDQRHGFLKIMQKAASILPGQTVKVWKDDFHPVTLFSEKWFYQKLEYLHENPVRKGFVEYAEHWKYSSARNWEKNDDRVIRIDRDALFLED